MSIYSAIQDFPLELQGPIKHLVDEIRNDVMTPMREDFSELKKVVTELAEAQKKTEGRLEELAEAQKKTEGRLEELAEAQKKTEGRLEELAEAQKKTEGRLEELAEAQKKTEERVEELTISQKELAEEVKKGFKQLNMKIDTISSRSGRNTENAIRNALEIILKITNFTVKREHIKDDELGEFELDIVIYNGLTIIVEVKSYVNYSDVYYFNKCVEKYIRLTGKTINRRLFVSPDVNLNAYEYGKELGIEFASC